MLSHAVSLVSATQLKHERYSNGDSIVVEVRYTSQCVCIVPIVALVHLLHNYERAIGATIQVSSTKVVQKKVQHCTFNYLSRYGYIWEMGKRSFM